MTDKSTQTTLITAANKRVDSLTRDLIGRVRQDSGTLRMLIILLLAFAFFTYLQPRIFLNPVNIQNIMISSPEIGIIALAMMLAMLTGGIDSSLMATNPNQAQELMPLILLLGLLVGLLGGLFNGFLISILGITPILATLGSMQIFNGLAIV